MNKITLTFVFVALLAWSCEEEEPERNPLTGTWVETYEEVSGCTDPNSDGTSQCDATDCVQWVITETTLNGAEFTNTDTEITVNGITYQYDIAGTNMTVSTTDAATGCTTTTTYAFKG